MRTEISLRRVNILVVLILAFYTWDFVYTILGSIVPWLGASLAGVLNLVVFTALCFLGLHCYVLCVLADAGSVPRDFEHDVEDVTSTYIQVKKKGGAARFCNKCSRPKPPRAHHCRQCHCCVLRMDHHCPWVNNCIGHGNYAAFLRFLFYTEVALIHCAVLLALHTHALLHRGRGAEVVTHIFRGSPDDAVAYLRVVLTHLATLSVTVPLAIGVGSLLGWHVYIVRQNKTTVEYHEGVTAHAFYREIGETFAHPYDVGVAENVQQVLGPSWGAWLAPAASLPGDGLHFPHSLRAANVAALRERLRANEPAPLSEGGTVQLTDRKGERKRDVYADQL